MKIIFIFLLCTTFTIAQENTEKPRQQSPEEVRKKILNQLFSQLDTATFVKVTEKAQQNDIPEQIILEARFLHFIDQNDHSALAKLAPELEAYAEKFNLELSEVFGVREDWLSIIQYTKALAALEKKDTASFKKHITEAFWLNPRHGQIYAPHIERLRLDHAMANVTLSPSLKLYPQQGGAPITLKTINNGSQATILHFWSPISQEVALNMDDFILTAHECTEHKIAVVSVLVGDSTELIKDAEDVRNKYQKKALCTWVKDNNTPHLTNTLRITDIPTMVIISNDGKILFNGHPSEPAFWKKIQTIAPKFKRPNNQKREHGDH